MACGRTKEKQLGASLPRNAGEMLYYERYGTVTPIPESTTNRKNAIQVAAILYIHHGMTLTEASRLSGASHEHLERTRRSDKWDAFAQELAQLTKPSNLTLIQSHDLGMLDAEHKRRMETLPKLQQREKELVDALETVEKGSREESTMVSNIQKLRNLIGDITGFDRFHKEMSSARQAALTAAAKEAPDVASTKKAKGKILDL